MGRLKHILSQNPTFDDCRKVTLVYDEALALDKKVRELHTVRNKTGHSQGPLVSRTSCYRKEVTSKVSFTCVYNFIFGNELTPLQVVMNQPLY